MTTAGFYNALAPDYHLLYGDWHAAIDRQGEALAQLLASAGVPPGSVVLDAACGIGTQTIGLVARGYRLQASDLSVGAVERLSQELVARDLSADLRVDDIQTLQSVQAGSMDAVIACDNSIPRLLSDDQILCALRSCYRSLRPGGVIVLSVRDYAAEDRSSPSLRPYRLHQAHGERFVAVQVWEWEGDHYDLRLYLTRESPDGTCQTQVLLSRYYAITTDRLLALLERAGFVDGERRDSVLFQPVLWARRPALVAPTGADSVA
ncbi:MAG: class I SAM-dependent methyltransferase [Burkholderiales bacterium]|nr:class I SAM-dependent methyltransferase [Burkholderiales bacterium]